MWFNGNAFLPQTRGVPRQMLMTSFKATFYNDNNVILVDNKRSQKHS